MKPLLRFLWARKTKKLLEDALTAHVKKLNNQKLIFTPGPASLSVENFLELHTAFGRGDAGYDAAEASVIAGIRSISGQDEVVRLQGSASLALEIMTLNFLCGRVVVVDTGYYSDRLFAMIEAARQRMGLISESIRVPWYEIGSFSGPVDWVVCAPVETSKALRIPISLLRAFSETLKAKLMLDATASIGLEPDHDLADVMAFSSCKGLFGFTGGAFVAYSTSPGNEVDSFYLGLETHRKKMITGPYHAILSLSAVLKNHDDMVHSVATNKERCLRKFSDFLVYDPINQPMLCTGVAGEVSSMNPRAILYRPRGEPSHSVVCHLGEVHLGRLAKGDILDALDIVADNDVERS